MVKRCPYLALVPAGVALVAAGARWLVQGSGNVYTTFAKRFYVPDPASSTAARSGSGSRCSA
jgi:hypothetical protein